MDLLDGWKATCMALFRLLRHFRLRFNAKVLMMGLRREVLVDWSDFKKFTAESKLIVD